ERRARLTVRFAMVERPPPRRLALAQLPRADPEGEPVDVWYPGQMLVRSRSAGLGKGGARLSFTSVPVGRSTVLAQVAAVTWPSDLPAVQTRTRANGDTALVEVAFDAAPGEKYTF